MSSDKVRQAYLKFMEEKGHVVVPSSSLIPENDPTALFITAGMQPLVPFLAGERHPSGKRIANVQKCLRTDDIDEVGDATHHTFFEMLGNWSLGDYFKKESIVWSYEFLTLEKWLNVPKEKLAFTIFEGDSEVQIDEEAKNIWLSLGISEKRIKALGKKDNWWGPAGETGPCGPDTEIFYWTGEREAPEEYDNSDKRWVEIWNNVFMQFNKKSDGRIEPLAQKNVDTGMGLERTLAVLNGFDDNYQTDLFQPIIGKIEEISEKKYDENEQSFRIIADHIKAAVFILADDAGIAPSNTKQGYIARRLIRRAIRYGKQLGVNRNFWLKDLAEEVREIYGNIYPELERNFKFVCDELDKEEEKFGKTLEKGLKELDKLFQIGGIGKNQEIKAVNRIDAEKAFYIYQTYGFPLEMIQEELAKRALFVDDKEFNKELQKHQELSRTASAGMFKGGLADAGEITTKYHTATHLLLAGLREVLGDHVFQKGSNITFERLRFDFSHPQKMTEAEIKKTEYLINEKIKAGLPVICEEMSLDEAKAKNAMGVFENKYGKRVKVYSIGNGKPFSAEICGGPHIKNTSEIGGIKIIKEEAVSSGIRRIKAVLSE